MQLQNGQGELGLQLVKVCSKVADCLAQRLAGFKIALLNINIPHCCRSETFKENVSKILPRDTVKALVVLMLVPRIMDVLKKVSLCINDFQAVITIGVWPSVNHLVAGANKLKVLLVRLALVAQRLKSFLVALNWSEPLAQGALINVTDSAGPGMS